MRRLAAISAVLVCAMAPYVHARDSHAPPGSSDRWLPCEDWVMYHWLPYDERDLYRALGSSRAEVLAWMRDDQRHTLAQLVRRAGLRVPDVSRRLVGAWAAARPAAERAELVRRASATLTQGHLAQHVLFHYFHHPGVALRATSIFGVGARSYQRLRLAGVSPAAIGALRGRSRARVAAGAWRALRSHALRGARGGAMPARQRRNLLMRQRRGLSHWLDSRIRKPGFDARRRLVARRGRDLLCHLFRGNSEPERVRR